MREKLGEDMPTEGYPDGHRDTSNTTRGIPAREHQTIHKKGSV
jgi:hypothetical protein